MNLLASLNSHVGKLVHPTQQGNRFEFIAHRNFLATRLAVSVGALVAAPLCLVLGDAPVWWQAGALAWLLLPIAAVASVSRTGNLARGEALSLATWIGLAVTLALGSGSATGLGLLLIVPFEAVLTLSALSTSALVAIGVAGGASIIVPWLSGLGVTASSDPLIVRFGAHLTTAAEAYAVVLALMASRLQKQRRRDERVGYDHYRELAGMIDQVLLRLDRSGMVLEAGAAARRLFGIAGRELMGRGLFEQVHVGDRPAFLKLVADAADGGGCGSATLRVRTGSTLPSEKGSFREPVFVWAELTVQPAASSTGRRTQSILCLMRDVTARRQSEAALDEAQRAAQHSETGRTLFLANVSHELRTPLNAIIGFADMLASEELGPRDPVKRREYAAIIGQSGQHLLAMVNTILDASKIEAGSFRIVPDPFDLAALIHGCCDMVGLRAETSAVEILRDVAPGLSEVVGDERAYKQIVLNLLSNAIKFTPGGGQVRVSARPEGTSIIVSVSDNGVGIKACDLPKLGSPFFQAQNSYDRAFDGTGLGLSVVRGLVGLHGGSIAIESAPGQGTRVCVRLPSDCRRHVRSSAGDTKIETIPRYVPSTQQAAGHMDLARVHKIA